MEYQMLETQCKSDVAMVTDSSPWQQVASWNESLSAAENKEILDCFLFTVESETGYKTDYVYLKALTHPARKTLTSAWFVNSLVIITARKRSCGQGYVFTSVCHSVNEGGVCLSACWDTTPWEQTPPRADTPLSGADTPLPGADTHTPGADTPQEQTPNSPREADSGIRSMSGRYASYWNAFVLSMRSDFKSFVFASLLMQC